MTNQQLARQHASQQRLLTAPAPPLEIVHLSLHETDPVTGEEDGLSALFYEYYRGYTIYSNAQGICCIHGTGRQGCLRLQGKYVSFPGIEDAKNMIKYFRAQGMCSWKSMDRSISEGEKHVRILNAPPLCEQAVSDFGTRREHVSGANNAERRGIAISSPLSKNENQRNLFQGAMPCYSVRRSKSE